jgi:hypothetical protein
MRPAVDSAARVRRSQTLATTVEHVKRHSLHVIRGCCSSHVGLSNVAGSGFESFVLTFTGLADTKA